jgi:hypothetical protein
MVTGEIAFSRRVPFRIARTLASMGELALISAKVSHIGGLYMRGEVLVQQHRRAYFRGRPLSIPTMPP